MSLKALRLPKYRHHKGSGQAFVQVKGHHHYLGKYDSEESRERYRRFIAELLASPATVAMRSGGSASARATTRPIGSPQVVELIAAYWRFARSYYVKDGQPTGWIQHIRLMLRLLRESYGHASAVDFGPLALKALRQKLIDAGHSRGYINKMIAIVPRMFKWAVGEELIPVATYQALAAVPGLRKGRTAAREPEPVTPVAHSVVDATLPHLPPIVADMVRFQRLTGARPTQICLIRPCDVDRSSDVWAYQPRSHKVEHHNRDRVIFIGPKAQVILRPYLLRPAESHCFSPQESVKQFRAEQRTRRKTKIQPSQIDRRKPRPKRQPRDHYTKDWYNRAIRRVCDREGIPRWHPNHGWTGRRWSRTWSGTSGGC